MRCAQRPVGRAALSPYRAQNSLAPPCRTCTANTKLPIKPYITNTATVTKNDVASYYKVSGKPEGREKVAYKLSTHSRARSTWHRDHCTRSFHIHGSAAGDVRLATDL